MKVKDLISELKELNPESQIFLSTDSEGNLIKAVHGVFDVGIGEESVLVKEIEIRDDIYDDDPNIGEFVIDWDALDYENEDGSGSWEGYEFDANAVFTAESYERFKKDYKYTTVYAIFPHV